MDVDGGRAVRMVATIRYCSGDTVTVFDLSVRVQVDGVFELRGRVHVDRQKIAR